MRTGIKNLIEGGLTGVTVTVVDSLQSQDKIEQTKSWEDRYVFFGSPFWVNHIGWLPHPLTGHSFPKST